MKTKSKLIEDLDTKLERDTETLNALGGSFSVNGIEIPPPTTAVLSLLEIIESPFITGFSSIEKIKLRHINEALYVLKYREKAVNELFDIIRFEKMAEKNADFFEKYLKTLNYNNFSVSVYKFAERLGCYNTLQVISDIQDYMSICFNGFEMIPSKEERKNVKKKETSITSG